MFQTHLLTMTRDDGACCANEMVLFHGTTASAAEDIVLHGFNRSFCGKNAALFGHGVYFAKDAAFAADKLYSPPAEGTDDRYAAT